MALSYYRNVRTTAKGRWYGKKLSDVATEFGYGSKLIGDPEHTVGVHDMVEYRVHVHEPDVPSLNLPDSILFENDQFVVINKPSGVPVHPTVNYFQHSVTEMMKSQFGSLYPCYRLDRLTSGVLILGKTPDFVSTFNNSLREKVYYARVSSQNLPASIRAKKHHTSTHPIVTFNGKLGFEKFKLSHAKAKSAETRMELMGDHDGLATLRVMPITGRTHQIRKHLALEGMPIHNDDLYLDGGLFKNLCEKPTEQNFEALWQKAERSRLAKLTGQNCDECGAPLYNRELQQLDLHCAVYKFGDRAFEAPSPFPIATNTNQ